MGLKLKCLQQTCYHVRQLAMLMSKVFHAHGFLRWQVTVHCTSTVTVFGQEQKQPQPIIFPTVASRPSLEGKQTGQETLFSTCKDERELMFFSVNMSSVHSPVLFLFIRLLQRIINSRHVWLFRKRLLLCFVVRRCKTNTHLELPSSFFIGFWFLQVQALHHFNMLMYWHWQKSTYFRLITWTTGTQMSCLFAAPTQRQISQHP